MILWLSGYHKNFLLMVSWLGEYNANGIGIVVMILWLGKHHTNLLLVVLWVGESHANHLLMVLQLF
jgi:hypothetical protein